MRENFTLKQIFGRFQASSEIVKNLKSPKSTIDTAINTSAEIIKRIPDFPGLMDKAEYALKLMAEGKLSLAAKSLEMNK